MSYSITQADILQWSKTYNGPRYHAAFMDAPYELNFMAKGWDNTGVAFRPEPGRPLLGTYTPADLLSALLARAAGIAWLWLWRMRG